MSALHPGCKPEGNQLGGHCCWVKQSLAIQKKNLRFCPNGEVNGKGNTQNKNTARSWPFRKDSPGHPKKKKTLVDLHSPLCVYWGFRQASIGNSIERSSISHQEVGLNSSRGCGEYGPSWARVKGTMHVASSGSQTPQMAAMHSKRAGSSSARNRACKRERSRRRNVQPIPSLLWPVGLWGKKRLTGA